MAVFRTLLRTIAALLHPVPIPNPTGKPGSQPHRVVELHGQIPVVIIHFGRARYLRRTVAQAERSGNTVFLIGDRSNRNFADHHFDAANYLQSAQAFRLRYRHLSHNPINSELACFMRWFILKDFMEALGLPVVFCCDSDVLLYSDVTNLREAHRALAGPVYVRAGRPAESRNAQAGEGFWTLADIQRLCAIIETAYGSPAAIQRLEQAFARLNAEGTQGGISDMTLLGVFAAEKEIQEGPTICDGETLCHNINDSEGVFEMANVWPAVVVRTTQSLIDFLKRHRMTSLEYIVSFLVQPQKIKAIHWKNGLPYAKLRESGKLVRLHSLHLAGRAKRLIGKLQRAAAASKKTDPELSS